MKNLLKNLGPIMILIGVIILSIYFFTGNNSNTFLAAAGIVMIAGFVSHVLINRRIQ